VTPIPQGRKRPAGPGEGVLSILSFSFVTGLQVSCPGRSAAPLGGACRAGTRLTRDQRNRCTWEALRTELICQIAPFRIEFFDQFNFPGAWPSLQRMLSRRCFENGFECLEIHRQIDAILPGEARNQLRLCSATGRARLFVTPMYRVPFRLLRCGQAGMAKHAENEAHCQSPWVPALRRSTSRRAASGTRRIDPVGLPVHLHKAGKAAYLG
jgi:hypothetical protein